MLTNKGRFLGRLFIVAAPSGAGKTSLVTALLKKMDNLEVSISYTTRPIRPGEIEGEHYHFVDEKTFQKMEQDGAFIETANVFGYLYGTTKAAVEKRLYDGIDVILEIDWQGARDVRKQFPNTLSIFILPPSKAALKKRILDRKQNQPNDIEVRLKTAASEIQHYEDFDYLLVNDEFESTLLKFENIFRVDRLRTARQKVELKALLRELVV